MVTSPGEDVPGSSFRVVEVYREGEGEGANDLHSGRHGGHVTVCFQHAPPVSCLRRVSLSRRLTSPSN